MNEAWLLSSDVHCRACDGTGVFVPIEFLQLERDIADVLAAFPAPDIMGKGQWFFEPATIVRTLAYMHQKGDIEGRNVACLGAPTVAVGLAVLQDKADLGLSVTLLDIDVDVLDVISTYFPSVHTYTYDLSDGCPDALKARYDCFFFDPLFSEEHYRVGLSRCVELIGPSQPGKSGYVVVPPGEIAPTRVLKDNRKIPLQLSIFRLLNEMGLCIADYRDNFMAYETPPAEIGISRHWVASFMAQASVGEWRSSDLVRVISTAITRPAVEGNISLQIRVNRGRRMGPRREYVQLDEIGSDEAICRMCPKCFSAHIQDQRGRHYTGYWPPEVRVRTMPSWRDEGDQPFQVAASCAAFENVRAGEIVVLSGPAARAIWETMRELDTEPGDSIAIRDILRRSLPDYEHLDAERIPTEVLPFLSRMMEIGLTRSRVLLTDDKLEAQAGTI